MVTMNTTSFWYNARNSIMHRERIPCKNLIKTSESNKMHLMNNKTNNAENADSNADSRKKGQSFLKI